MQFTEYDASAGVRGEAEAVTCGHRESEVLSQRLSPTLDVFIHNLSRFLNNY